MKNLILAALAATAIAAPAHATVVTLTFSGNLTSDTPYSGADFAYTAEQLAYYNSLHRTSGMTVGSAYDFTFRYDTTTTAVGGKYAVEMLSGSVGSNTDFSSFDKYLKFEQFGNLVYMRFWVEKFSAPGKSLFATFAFADNDGDLTAGLLPPTPTPAAYDFVGTTFEIFNNGGIGRGFAQNNGVGVTVQTGPGEPPVGGVPEPATWAMMVLGFGAAGAAVRRRRTLAA